jgi:hypothetical protein
MFATRNEKEGVAIAIDEALSRFAELAMAGDAAGKKNTLMRFDNRN